MTTRSFSLSILLESIHHLQRRSLYPAFKHFFIDYSFAQACVFHCNLSNDLFSCLLQSFLSFSIYSLVSGYNGKHLKF